MYSYEDRIRAVPLYLIFGKRAAATVRQLGYPSLKALKAEYREFKHSRDLKLSRASTWQKYPDEQKQIAVNHYLTHGHCLAETVKALGYPYSETLNVRIQKLHSEIRDRILGHTAGVHRSAELLKSWRLAGQRCTTGRMSYSVIRLPYP